MNERIKLLSLQASDSIPDDVSAEHAMYLFQQKFAELIVTECVQAVRDQYESVLEDKAMMTDTHWDGYVQCGVDAVVGIKEHFGVE